MGPRFPRQPAMNAHSASCCSRPPVPWRFWVSFFGCLVFAGWLCQPIWADGPIRHREPAPGQPGSADPTHFVFGADGKGYLIRADVAGTLVRYFLDRFDAGGVLLGSHLVHAYAPAAGTGGEMSQWHPHGVVHADGHVFALIRQQTSTGRQLLILKVNESGTSATTRNVTDDGIEEARLATDGNGSLAVVWEAGYSVWVRRHATATLNPAYAAFAVVPNNAAQLDLLEPVFFGSGGVLVALNTTTRHSNGGISVSTIFHAVSTTGTTLWSREDAGDYARMLKTDSRISPLAFYVSRGLAIEMRDLVAGNVAATGGVTGAASVRFDFDIAPSGNQHKIIAAGVQTVGSVDNLKLARFNALTLAKEWEGNGVDGSSNARLSLPDVQVHRPASGAAEYYVAYRRFANSAYSGAVGLHPFAADGTLSRLWTGIPPGTLHGGGVFTGPGLLAVFSGPTPQIVLFRGDTPAIEGPSFVGSYEGGTLTLDYDEATPITWYRNGVLLTGPDYTNKTSIHVSDSGIYTVKAGSPGAFERTSVGRAVTSITAPPQPALAGPSSAAQGGTQVYAIASPEATAYEWEITVGNAEILSQTASQATVRFPEAGVVRLRARGVNTPAQLPGGNRGPWSDPFQVTVTANTPPVFGGYRFSVLAGQSGEVAKEKILARASDADGHALTLTGVPSASARGGVIAETARSITYTPPDKFIGEDSFSVTISDGFGGEVSGTVTVEVQEVPNVSPNFVQLKLEPGGNASVQFYGIPGHTYTLQRSTDLVDWIDVQTLTAAANGLLAFVDEDPPAGAAFYRTRFVP